jgi:WD40 repeat protein
MGIETYRNFSVHTDEIKSIAFIPGQREFFTAGADGKIIKWGLDKRNQSLQVIYSGSEIINVLAVSPDEKWLASGSQNSGIRMIPLSGNEIGMN